MRFLLLFFLIFLAACSNDSSAPIAIDEDKPLWDIVKEFVAGVVTNFGLASTDTCLNSCDDERDSFDFIVVGAGAGGGPLAANLARKGYEVLLLEAGAEINDSRGPNLTYQVPALHAKASEDTDLSWRYFVSHYQDHQQAIRDSKFVSSVAGESTRGIFYPRGAGVGGSASVNAMVTVYPHNSDWDYIADVTGDDSWRAEKMRDYFKRLERNTYLNIFNKGPGHGFEGWLTTSLPGIGVALEDLQLSWIAKAAAYSMGETPLDDFNELLNLAIRDLNALEVAQGQIQGAFMVPGAIDKGRRYGVREYVLSTIEAGYPLTLRTESLVTAVVFVEETEGLEQPRALGVRYLAAANLYRADRQAQTVLTMPTEQIVEAKHEVILSAGAFNTPQLLMLSGIGPQAALQTLGIDVVKHLPGVGQNLQDRYEVGVVTELSQDLALIQACSFDANTQDACLEAWQDQTGPYRSNGAVVSAIHRSSVAENDTDLFIFGLPGDFRGYFPGYSQRLFEQRNTFTWTILKAHTRNRAGSVRLASTDPLEPPLIDFAYFEQGAELDLQAMIEGVQWVREVIVQANALGNRWEMVEVWPGAAIQSREDIKQWVRDEAWGHHAAGTAAMGSDDDPMAVLDSRFRVRGIDGLRVVDASVFPRIPGFFIAVPIYMISEKAADVIVEDLEREKQP